MPERGGRTVIDLPDDPNGSVRYTLSAGEFLRPEMIRFRVTEEIPGYWQGRVSYEDPGAGTIASMATLRIPFNPADVLWAMTFTFALGLDTEPVQFTRPAAVPIPSWPGDTHVLTASLPNTVLAPSQSILLLVSIQDLDGNFVTTPIVDPTITALVESPFDETDVVPPYTTESFDLQRDQASALAA